MKAEKLTSNQFGIYHDTYRPKDTKQRNHCYYSRDPDGNDQVNSPPIGKAWYNTFPRLDDEIPALERATWNNKVQRQFPPGIIELVSNANQALQHKNQNNDDDERAAKGLHQSEITTTNYTACHSTRGCRSRSEEDCNGIILGEVTTGEDASPGLAPPHLAPGYNIW